MTSDSIDKDSIRSLSPIVIDNYHSRNILSLLSCYGCSRIRKTNQQQEEKQSNVQKGFFKRIQFFKAQKRQSSLRKQQLTTTTTTVPNGHLTIEIDPLPNEQYISTKSSSHFINNSQQSIPFLNRIDSSYSFTDIEVESSINEQKFLNPNATPKSRISNNFSSATTNLSTCSTQSLLRRLLDKAQILDEYYKDVSHKSRNYSISSLSSSSNSLLGKSDGRSRSFIHSSYDSSMKKLQRRKYRNMYDNMSSDSSRFNLYVDEDNILKELVRFNNDIDLILSRLETDDDNNIQSTTNHCSLLNENLIEQTINNTPDISPEINNNNNPEEIDQTMRIDINEINIHSILANDINRLRETALSKLLKMAEDICHLDNEIITLNKLNKLPKSSTWKNKHVFGVPLRIYQQTTGHILPIGIINSLQYIRLHAGKCDGLFRKPGVKSKIDRLRIEIEKSLDIIKYDEYQPFVVADVIRQYFRELPECIIPPLITRLLCNLLKYITQDEQLLAIRYTFLLLSDETREVLEIILRFLFDISIKLGNNQTTCRSLARIFLPSVFQSYDNIQQTTSKTPWWKWKTTKSDVNQQENERLILEQCLMTMILNIDLLCRVPSALSSELNLPSIKTTKNLDELVRNECNGDFHLKKYISKKTEEFLQRLSNIKFKTVSTNLDDINISIHKSSSNENNLPIWKCSINIPNINIKQVQQRILYERYLWDNYFAESRIIERIDNEKEIIQYVLNSHDLMSIRSFCEFRFSKKITSRSISDENSILISSTSIDHLQNHFLPGCTGITYEMYYYLTQSSTHTTVTQIACVDYSGRSSQWYENVYGLLLAHNLISLRDTFINTKIVRV